jgi:hypothetical protein
MNVSTGKVSENRYIITRIQNQAHVLLRLRHRIFTAPHLGEKKTNNTKHSTTKQIID